VQPPLQKQHEWNAAAFEDAFTVLNFQSLEIAEMFFGDAILLITGCVRALFVASPGHDLIASDYSAIEGVVGAVIAGEQWRIETFEKGEDIYLKSASNTTGKSYEFYLEYKKSTGKHHPDRQPYGKIDELSSFYGGGIGAQKAFGADEYFTDDQIRDKVRKWRRASPRVVQLWGGQERPDQFGTWQKELFGLEGAAIRAVQIPWTPGHVQASHPLSPAITFLYDGNALYCILPSGRRLTYHQPRLTVGTKFSVDNLTLCFWGWNTNPKMGAVGWVLMDTYGGKLTENVVQAVARDILAYAIVKAQKAGYPVVLHIHDEIVAELPHGVGSVAQLESIMSDLPPWAKGWPLVAKGGWRGRRYRKD
jgi:DNA polymerase